MCFLKINQNKKKGIVNAFQEIKMITTDCNLLVIVWHKVMRCGAVPNS